MKPRIGPKNEELGLDSFIGVPDSPGRCTRNAMKRRPVPGAQKAFSLPLYPFPEIKTILGRTLVFRFTFPLGRGPFCHGLPSKRATAFGILKLAGSSNRLPGPLPRRFQPRTIFFERCFMCVFECPVVYVSIFVKPSKIPLVGPVPATSSDCS